MTDRDMLYVTAGSKGLIRSAAFIWASGTYSSTCEIEATSPHDQSHQLMVQHFILHHIFINMSDITKLVNIKKKRLHIALLNWNWPLEL